MIFGAIPDRDAMSPPQLAADTPILYILEPVEIGLFETFRHDLDAPVFHSGKTRICKRLDLHEPLGRDHRLDDLSAALCARDGGAVGFGLDDEFCGLHIVPYILTRGESILTL